MKDITLVIPAKSESDSLPKIFHSALNCQLKLNLRIVKWQVYHLTKDQELLEKKK